MRGQLAILTVWEPERPWPGWAGMQARCATPPRSRASNAEHAPRLRRLSRVSLPSEPLPLLHAISMAGRVLFRAMGSQVQGCDSEAAVASKGADLIAAPAAPCCPGPVTALAVSGDETLLLVGTAEGSVAALRIHAPWVSTAGTTGRAQHPRPTAERAANVPVSPATRARTRRESVHPQPPFPPMWVRDRRMTAGASRGLWNRCLGCRNCSFASRSCRA